MSSTKPDQVQMVWPETHLEAVLPITLPTGYVLRNYQPGDEPAFYDLMASVGWLGWDDEKLQPWLYRILPEGWFMVAEENSGEITATCMATHDHTWQQPFCGEVGWTAVHPAHQKQGLGTAVVSAVVNRFLQSEYSILHLYTEVWRTAAIKMYLRLGFVPYLDPPGSIDRWRVICGQIGHLFSPDSWRSQGSSRGG